MDEENGVVYWQVQDYKGSLHALEFPIFENTRVRWNEELGVVEYVAVENGELMAQAYPVEVIRQDDKLEYDERGLIKGGTPYPVVAFTDQGLKLIQGQIYMPKEIEEYTKTHMPLPIALNPKVG